MKDSKSKLGTKPILDKIEEEYSRNINELRAKLIDKLFILVNGKTSQGVKDYYNKDIIPKGVKFTQKILQDIDYDNVNPNKWTTDKDKNDTIKELLHNFMLKSKEIDGDP